jgi:hypothetical protein
MGITVSDAIALIKAAPPDAIIGLVGPPGFGKSAAPEQAAREMGWSYLCRYAALMETVEINGCPHLIDRVTGYTGESKVPDSYKVGQWAPFEGLFPLANESRWDDQPVLLTFDDIGQASPSVTKACIRTAYGDGIERMVGMQKLHPNTRVCFTANLHTHRAGAHRFESYVTNRVTMVEVEPEPMQWCSWAIEHAVNPEVVGYVRWTKVVTDFAPEKDSFMSPRSLVKLGSMIDALDKASINGHILRSVAYGTIGEQAGSSFLAYHALAEHLPDMDKVLAGDKVKLPERAEVLYMFVSSFLRASKEKHVPVAAQLINDLTKTGGVGFEVAAFLTFEALKGGAAHLRGLRTQQALYQWLGQYGKYLPLCFLTLTTALSMLSKVFFS